MSAAIGDERTAWGDARLDELARRVEHCATKSDVDNLRGMQERANVEMRRELTEARTGVQGEVQRVGAKVEDLLGDPLSEKRARNQAMVVAIIGAGAGGFMTFLVFIVSGGVG